MKYLITLVLLISLVGCGHLPTPKPWTTGEKTMLGWSVLASAADAYTTVGALNNPYNYEVNPIMGKHPSNSRIIATICISELIAVAVSHWYPVIDFPLIGKVNMRYGFLGFKATVNTGCALNNRLLLDWD